MKWQITWTVLGNNVIRGVLGEFVAIIGPNPRCPGPNRWLCDIYHKSEMCGGTCNGTLPLTLTDAESELITFHDRQMKRLA